MTIVSHRLVNINVESQETLGKVPDHGISQVCQTDFGRHVDRDLANDRR